MEATEILMSEHRVIERMIATLEAATKTGGRAGRAPGFLPGTWPTSSRDSPTAAITGRKRACYLRRWWPPGCPSRPGRSRLMLSEHEQGRVFTRGMRAAAQRGWRGCVRRA